MINPTADITLSHRSIYPFILVDLEIVILRCKEITDRFIVYFKIGYTQDKLLCGRLIPIHWMNDNSITMNNKIDTCWMYWNTLSTLRGMIPGSDSVPVSRFSNGPKRVTRSLLPYPSLNIVIAQVEHIL